MTEPFLTTVVGSLPKPAWLLEQISMNADGGKQVHGRGADWMLKGDALKAAQDDATRLAVRDQERAGIDIVSDGEQRRKSWLTYVTMQFDGYDYENLVKKVTRAGRRTAEVGQCVGEVRRTLPVLENDLRFTQSITHLPVKITLPGPLSVVDSTHDAYFGEERTHGLAVAAALNAEAKALDSLGPALIQFDEPAFSRYPEKVKDWGIVLDCVPNDKLEETLDAFVDELRESSPLAQRTIKGVLNAA